MSSLAQSLQDSQDSSAYVIVIELRSMLRSGIQPLTDVIDPSTSPRHKNANLGTVTRNFDSSLLSQTAHGLRGPSGLLCPERAVLVVSSCKPLALVLYHMSMSLSPEMSEFNSFPTSSNAYEYTSRHNVWSRVLELLTAGPTASTRRYSACP